MKKAIILFKVIALVFAIAIIGCKKDPGPKGDTGAQGPQGPQGISGPQAKTFTFTLTFNAGETYKSYGGITGFNTDDVLLVYVFNANYGDDYYVQLPYLAGGSSGVNFYAEFSEVTGYLFINTEWGDGSPGSPWSSTVNFKFKAVLISSSQYKAFPNLDWTNYNEVKSTLNLKD